MKKTIMLILSLVLCLSLCACELSNNAISEICYHYDTEPATCSSPETCADCGVVLSEALEHVWEPATCLRAKTCQLCSTVEGYPDEHNYDGGRCVWCYAKDPTYLDVKDNEILTINQINFDINSAGGVEVDIEFTNQSQKQISYVFFTLKFYDRMGGPAYCEIRDTDTRRLRYTGPVNARTTETGYWDPIIYCSSTAAIKPLTIEIEYTDGTKQTINSTGRYWYSSSYYGGDLRD